MVLDVCVVVVMVKVMDSALGQSAGAKGGTQWDCAKEVRCTKGRIMETKNGIYT